MTPGSASAAASSTERRWIPACAGMTAALRRSIAATTASADPVAAAGCFLALVDVLRGLRLERIGVELHLRLREVALLPRLRRSERCARAEEQRARGDNAGPQPAHGRDLSSALRAGRGCVARRRASAHRESPVP